MDLTWVLFMTVATGQPDGSYIMKNQAFYYENYGQCYEQYAKAMKMPLPPENIVVYHTGCLMTYAGIPKGAVPNTNKKGAMDGVVPVDPQTNNPFKKGCANI